MSGHREGDGDVFQMTVISPQLVKQEDNQAPLLVAMQPGVEVKTGGKIEGAPYYKSFRFIILCSNYRRFC